MGLAVLVEEEWQWFGVLLVGVFPKLLGLLFSHPSSQVVESIEVGVCVHAFLNLPSPSSLHRSLPLNYGLDVVYIFFHGPLINCKTFLIM